MYFVRLNWKIIISVQILTMCEETLPAYTHIITSRLMISRYLIVLSSTLGIYFVSDIENYYVSHSAVFLDDQNEG